MKDQTGYAVCLYQDKKLSVISQERIQNENSVFQAEMAALHAAITHVKNQEQTSVLILSDSLSALQALSSPNQRNPQIIKTQEILYDIQYSSNINFSWVRAHSGEVGNEEADRLAKEATSLSQIDKSIPLPISYIKSRVQSLLLQEWQNEWDTEERGRFTWEFIPKVSTSFLSHSPSISAFLTGHGPFLDYLLLRKKLNTDMCSCGEIGNSTHYLFHCPLTQKWHLREHTRENNALWCKGFCNNRTLLRKHLDLYKWLLDNVELIQHV